MPPKNLRAGHFLCLVLITAIGALIYHPFLDYQPWLSQGDHGNQLYIFYETFLGRLPYRTAFSLYGPLMPYYYALFFWLFGVKIKSVLLARVILNIASAAVFYSILELITSSVFMAFLGGVWFLLYNPDFPFCYNHTGGILTVLLSAYFLLGYLKNRKISFLHGGVLCLLALFLIKLNIGAAATAAFLACLCIGGLWHKKFIALFTGLLAAVFMIYFLLFAGLPSYYVRQCMPYFNQAIVEKTSLAVVLKCLYDYLWFKINFSWSTRMMALLALPSVFLFGKSKSKSILACLSIFYVLFIHEFLLNPHSLYKIFWGDPFLGLLLFTLFYDSVHRWKWLHRAATFFLAVLIATELVHALTFQKIPESSLNLKAAINHTSAMELRYFASAVRNPGHFMPLHREEIYVNNDMDWLRAVEGTVNFLDKNLKKDETFYALPYDPLYYFLTKKEAPVRETMLFDCQHIAPEQEEQIMRTLERKKIDWVLLSNRQRTREDTLGYFGETYCPRLADYLHKNFSRAAEFGAWDADPGWAWNHAVMILKRNSLKAA